MAEETVETTAETAVETESAAETAEKPDKSKAILADLAKERRARQAAEKRLQELDDANKSELTKAQERAAEAEKASQGHEAIALRLQVAFDKGLTPSQAKRLVGTTRDELEADADEIVRDFAAAKRPSGSIDQGPRGGTVKADPRQAFADLLAGKST